MTPSTKPEVHNVSQCSQWRPQPRSSCRRKNSEVWPCWFWVMPANRQTNRQRNRRNILHPSRVN